MQSAYKDDSRSAEYLKVHFMKKEYAEKFLDLEEMVKHIREHAKLTLTDVPDRIEPINNLLDLPLSGPYDKQRILFAKHHWRIAVPITTDSQLMILIMSLDHLLGCHKHGKSWGGVWSRKNWDMTDGKPCLSAPTQPGGANQDSCKLDLAKFAEEFLSPFAAKDGRFPANMASLFKELKNPMNLLDHEFFGWYYEFLAYHPCFSTAAARLFLVTGWYHLIEYLRYEKIPEYAGVFGLEVKWTSPFLDKNRVHRVLYYVFWNDKPPSSILPYHNTLGHNFKLMCQIQEHVYRNTKLTGDLPSIEKSDESDLYAEDQYPFTLADLIKALFTKHQMVGEFLDRYEQFKKLRGPLSRRGG